MAFCDWQLLPNNVFEIHSRCSIGSILHYLWGWMVFHGIYRPHFVYPFSSCWTFDLFLLLAIMNNMVMNIHVQGFVRIYVFNYFEYIIGVELLTCMATLCLIFWGPIRLFSKEAVHFTTPLEMHEASNFPHNPNAMIVWLFYYSHPCGFAVVVHCGFDLHFLVTNYA